MSIAIYQKFDYLKPPKFRLLKFQLTKKCLVTVIINNHTAAQIYGKHSMGGTQIK